MASALIMAMALSGCAGNETIIYCDAGYDKPGYPACEGTTHIMSLWDWEDDGWKTYDYSFEKEGKKVVGIVTYGYGWHHHYRVTYR